MLIIRSIPSATTITPLNSVPNTERLVSVTHFSSCITDYNAAAAELFASKPDVVVADLNGAVHDVCGAEYTNCNLQLWNNVHFTEAGKQFCAVHVAKNIAPLLGPKWAKLVPEPKSLGEVEGAVWPSGRPI